MDRLKLAAALESLEPFRHFVDKHVKGCGLPAALMPRVELVLEEVLTNIIHYAYPSGTGEVQVECGIDEGTQRFRLRFTDWGLPFDPLSRESPDLTKHVCDMAVGGLGIFLLRQLAEGIHYARKGDRNILTLYLSPMEAS